MRRRALLLALFFLVLLPFAGYSQDPSRPWGTDRGSWNVYYVAPEDLAQALHVLESRGETPSFIVQASTEEVRDCSGYGCHVDPTSGQTICIDPPPTGCPTTGVSNTLLFAVVCRKN